MISSLIAYCLWLSAAPKSNALVAQDPLKPVIGRKVSHLHSFFDARSLSPGQPVCFYLPAIVPSFTYGPTAVESASVVRKPTISVRSQSSQKRIVFSQPSTRQPHHPSPENAIIESLNLVKAPLATVLDAINIQTGANFLMIADPEPILTIHAKNRRFIDLLGDISALTGLSYLKVGDEFVVAPDEKLKASYPADYAAAHPEKPAPITVQPEIVTESYHTDYCDGTKLIEAVQPQFKDSVTMIAAPSTATTDLSQQDQSSVSGVSSSVLGNADEGTKSSRVIVLQGSRDKVEQAISLMRKLDVAPAQVNIGVTINDLSLDAEKNLGLEWTFSQESLTEQQPNGIGFAQFNRSPLSFTATMNALQTEGKDKLLASPNITVMDGQRAYILVGQRLEFPVITSVQQNGQPLYNVQEERVGIYLQVSVWVTNDGRVKLQLYPQVSTVTGFSNINGGSYPQIATREAQTTLTVGSGHTIVIGGLIHDEDIVNLQKVPILSQIPLFGQLFTNRDHQKTRDEVVITITPTISPAQ